MRLPILLLLLFKLACFQAIGQQPASSGNDSIQVKIEKIERERIQDSLSKIDLEESISTLNQSETQKRRALERQLQEIKNRDSIRLQQIKTEVEQLRQVTIGYPVMGLMNDTLFLLYTRHGGFSAAARSKAISDRIEKLAKEIAFVPDSLKWQRNETNIEINYVETVIMTLSETDAVWNNTGIEQLATLYTDSIRKSITRYRVETSFSTLAKEVGIAIGILLLLGVILLLVTKFFGWVTRRIEAGKENILKGLK
jgi:hypothetical protein